MGYCCCDIDQNKKKTLEELFKTMLHNLTIAKIRVKDENEKI